MKPVSVLALLCFSVQAFCQSLCIQNVTVVDVEKRLLVPGKNVIVSRGLITSVKPAGPAPSGHTVIDGKGKFLMPGMTDAHIHFFQSGGLYTRPDAADLRHVHSYEQEIAWTQSHMHELCRRYLKAGITQVVDVGATHNLLRLRDSMATAPDVPRILMTGPLLTTFEPPVYKGLGDNEPFHLVTDTAQARQRVCDQLPFKPDFIKIWYIVKRDSFQSSAMKYLPIVQAIISESHKHGLKVAVHATELLTATLAVQSGCDFLVHSVDDEVITDELVALMKKNHVLICPTLTVHDGYRKTFLGTHAHDPHDIINADPFQLGSLNDIHHLDTTSSLLKARERFGSAATTSRFRVMDSVKAINLKKLSDAGVTIIAGTDAGNIGTMHASSYVDELRAMESAGMSTWDVLRSATINGIFAPGYADAGFGIAQGRAADLVLLDSNPVADLNNLKRIHRVIRKGVVFDPDTLIPETPLTLVQRQLNAYNMRDIEAFLEPFADDVELYDFPEKPIGKGKDEMRKKYGAMFAKAEGLHCEVRQRIVQGNTVIDKEYITLGGSATKREAVAIYVITGKKIGKVTFIR